MTEEKGRYLMYAYIRGILKDIDEESVVLDVGGVGYEIVCANPYAFYNKEDTEVLIHTYHHIREDAQLLYGFETTEQKALFKKIISVSGIGPKSGLSILGSVNVGDFASAVEAEDDKYLMQFPGIGKKTARQIILDLKGKLEEFSHTVETKLEQDRSTAENTVVAETKEALKSLGYTDREINTIANELHKYEDKTVDELIPVALSLLVKS